jgi:hypothetical protein
LVEVQAESTVAAAVAAVLDQNGMMDAAAVLQLLLPYGDLACNYDSPDTCLMFQLKAKSWQVGKAAGLLGDEKIAGFGIDLIVDLC